MMSSRPTRHRFPIIQALVLLLLLAAVAGWGLFSRLSAEAALTRQADEALIPTVVTVTATAGPGNEDVVLPGTVQPLIEAPIYARTSGYLKSWSLDIGSPVKKGQILAELETPEVDQQLRQAEADYATAQANDALAQSSAKRWQALLATDSVSKQDNDEKQADAAAKHATLASALANLTRLRELEGFKHVVAPFDGAALFHVADTSRLRIYVQVPEAFAPLIKPGTEAQLTTAVDPTRAFAAKVVRTADALDSLSRTLLVEIQADNSQRQIIPGGYAQVHFQLPLSAGHPRVPVSTLIFRANGLQLATVDQTQHAHLVGIKLGRDFGTSVEVASGLQAGDLVINSPPDSLSDGDQVKLAAARDKR
jgi:RND family efflux transporter MFP subunit